MSDAKDLCIFFGSRSAYKMTINSRLRQLAKLASLLIVACLAASAQTAKLETLGPLTDGDVPDAVRKVLDTKGYRVHLGDGSVLCEIWLRGQLAAATRKGPSDALYSQVSESTMFGVISFPQAATDFRGQAIKPGFYTLRYELSPDDGNHLGVSQYRDFLLLVPATRDVDPDKALSFDELVNLSRGGTGTKHPGPLSLLQSASGDTPSISQNSDGFWVLSAAVRLSSGENLPFGLIVKGSAPQ
jgi:hypothetical protein